jgi:phosphate transport system substrate-binding protein
VKKFPLSAVALVAIVSGSAGAQAAGRDTISIVGSSTVYPFATVVAERFGRSTGFKTPKIESTGSGGGLKLFCKGVGANTPDITNSSRRIKQSEYDDCQNNGVTEIVEVLEHDSREQERLVEELGQLVETVRESAGSGASPRQDRQLDRMLIE